MEDEGSEEEQEYGARLTGSYRQFVQGMPVVMFRADKPEPDYYLSNLTVVPSGIDFDGVVYPSVEHAFQAQKFHPSVRLCRPTLRVAKKHKNHRL